MHRILCGFESVPFRNCRSFHYTYSAAFYWKCEHYKHYDWNSLLFFNAPHCVFKLANLSFLVELCMHPCMQLKRHRSSYFRSASVSQFLSDSFPEFITHRDRPINVLPLLYQSSGARLTRCQIWSNHQPPALDS